MLNALDATFFHLGIRTDVSVWKSASLDEENFYTQ